jgi:hypothetical protein
MAVMPDGRDTEEPDAGHGRERAAGATHEDILARLLEYRRRLQEEIGDEPASFGEERNAPPSARAEDVPAEPVAVSEETRSEREHPTRRARNRRTPVSSRSGSTVSTRPWLASRRCSRCSEGEMIAGETTVIRSPDDTSSATHTLPGIGAVAQSVRAADS